MIIFWRILFGHLLADFTLQTNTVNRLKRSHFWGMLLHCAMHPILYALLTYPYLNRPWIELGSLHLNGWICVLILFAAHWIEDEWRVYTIFKYHTPDNTLYFLWDQTIHYVVIFAVAPLLEFSNPSLKLIPEIWPLLGSLFVVVTHMTTVFVYFLEKDIFGAEYPKTLEKYAGMAERLGLALCFLAPTRFWPILACALTALLFFIRFKKWCQGSWFSFYVGIPIAALCGLAARVLYYPWS